LVDLDGEEDPKFEDCRVDADGDRSIEEDCLLKELLEEPLLDILLETPGEDCLFDILFDTEGPRFAPAPLP
jgi:hypothetical protein